MTDPKSKPGPPPALEVEIVKPSTANNPIDVDMLGMIEVEVRATGGHVVEVKADSYAVGSVAPADPTFTLNPHATHDDLFVGQIPAPCNPQSPFAKFRIRAVVEFEAPGGGMDPNEKVPDDAGVYEGKCLAAEKPGCGDDPETQAELA